MPKAIYLNLIVEDLKRTKVFFEALGFSFNKQFTNDEAAAMVISETINVMLHTQESIKRFTRKQLVDSKKQTEALIALQFDGKQAVDELIEKAINAGASEYREADKYDFMYARTFEDLDGHIWEAFWME